jgi:hypothetical protein
LQGAGSIGTTNQRYRFTGDATQRDGQAAASYYLFARLPGGDFQITFSGPADPGLTPIVLNSEAVDVKFFPNDRTIADGSSLSITSATATLTYSGGVNGISGVVNNVSFIDSEVGCTTSFAPISFSAAIRVNDDGTVDDGGGPPSPLW